MKPTYIMIGGFLGAGKTTTVGRLARHYIQQGRQVGIITNDQTTDLVDTHSLRCQGFDVGEVAGACFCCNFEGLTSTLEALHEGELPDVILAEPVGSCTDLVATVLRPLSRVYDQPLDIAPYGVILKPSHGLRILRNQKAGGFSPQAAYIFRKQLEESDFVIINRIDEMEPDQIEELRDLLESNYPDRPVICVSAKTGEGFDALEKQLAGRGSVGSRAMAVDYDVYAQGEAELGWLNAQSEVTATQSFDLDASLLDIVSRLKVRFVESGGEAAHVKAIGMRDGHYAVANLVSNQSEAELSLASQAKVSTANVVVNARVAIDPEQLELIVREEVAATFQEMDASIEFTTLQSFRPGRPVPTHRIEAEVSGETS